MPSRYFMFIFRKLAGKRSREDLRLLSGLAGAGIW